MRYVQISAMYPLRLPKKARAKPSHTVSRCPTLYLIKRARTSLRLLLFAAQSCLVDVDPQTCGTVILTAPSTIICTVAGDTQGVVTIFNPSPPLCIFPVSAPCSAIEGADPSDTLPVCEPASAQAVQAFAAATPDFRIAAGVVSRPPP